MKHFAMWGNVVFLKFVIKTESPTSLLLSFDSNACCLVVAVFLAVGVTIYVLLYSIFFCPFDYTIACTWPGSFPFALVFIYFFWGVGGVWVGGGMHMHAQCLLFCL